jgi:uncharacterized protein YdhG (YjbR/CyaY superfamily)
VRNEQSESKKQFYDESLQFFIGSIVFMASKAEFQTIDEYIATFPKNIQAILQQLRQAIKEAAPQAEETISYQMPAFKQKGILVWFAAFKNHIGFFPKASAIEAFKEKLSPYETSKGTIQFSIDQPLPLDLVKEIVRYRVKENLAGN